MSKEELLDCYLALPEEGRRLVEEFVSLVGRTCTPTAPKQPKGDITDDPFFGMWADREDMKDPDYVRKLRRREWREPA
jgi:hypothetical protein